MTLRRYDRTTIFGSSKRYGTSFLLPIIRKNVELGNIRITEMVSKENDRLDILAGRLYGDARLWWVICVCSNIGYVPQVPPGTLLKIPNLEDIQRYV